MADLSNLKKLDEVEETEDSVGGGFEVLDSGLYKATIEMAYMGKSSGGADALHLDFVTDNNQRLSSIIYLTSRTGKNTYTDKKTKKERYLPGFSLGSDVVSLAGKGIEIANVTLEKKTIQKYDFNAKSMQPLEVDSIKDIIGNRIIIGLIRHKQNKQKLHPDGSYKKVAGLREFNELDKVFDVTSQLTVWEINKGVTTPTFLNTWHSKWQGKVEDTYEEIKEEDSTKASAEVDSPFG